MVKLFVGNLADSVDKHRLRNLFLQYVHVQECDVLKNFAFVHVVTEEDAELAITKLEKHNLDGREIHVERSTSRLRKEPGMSDKCFTCGAFDHKTPFCPFDSTISSSSNNNSISYVNTTTANLSSAANVVTGQKRSEEPVEPSGTTVVKKARYLLSYLEGDPQRKAFPGVAADSKISEETDPELPQPQNPELRMLYEQYIESRTRYYFFRERLKKEINLLVESKTFVAATQDEFQKPIHLGTIDLTRRHVAANNNNNPSSISHPKPNNNVFNNNASVLSSSTMPLSSEKSVINLSNRMPASTIIQASSPLQPTPSSSVIFGSGTPSSSVQSQQFATNHSTVNLVLPPHLPQQNYQQQQYPHPLPVPQQQPQHQSFILPNQQYQQHRQPSHVANTNSAPTIVTPLPVTPVISLPNMAQSRPSFHMPTVANSSFQSPTGTAPSNLNRLTANESFGSAHQITSNHFKTPLNLTPAVSSFPKNPDQQPQITRVNLSSGVFPSSGHSGAQQPLLKPQTVRQFPAEKPRPLLAARAPIRPNGPAPNALSITQRSSTGGPTPLFPLLRKGLPTPPNQPPNQNQRQRMPLASSPNSSSRFPLISQFHR